MSNYIEAREMYAAAKQKKFCVYCLHDLWYEDWCHECDTKVPETYEEFQKALEIAAHNEGN